MFVDESGARTTLTRLYGWAAIGRRVIGRAPYNWQKTTLVAALTAEGPTAPLVFPGAMDTLAWRVYVEEVLVKSLRPGDVVILDNWACHHDAEAQQAIEAVGAELLPLPPYSFDYNPIEQMWSQVKAYLRKAKPRTFTEVVRAIGEALAQVTPRDAAGYFAHAGYHDWIPEPAPAPT